MAILVGSDVQEPAVYSSEQGLRAVARPQPERPVPVERGVSGQLGQPSCKHRDIVVHVLIVDVEDGVCGGKYDAGGRANGEHD